MKGEGSNWMCGCVLKGKREFWVKGCGGVVERAKRKKRDDDEKMREKVDEISNERGESVWCEW